MDKKWDERFLAMASMVASWSKDPSTKCGAVIVGKNKEILSLGYNGFPRGVSDMQNRLEDREKKYRYIVHSEVNAVISAGRRAEGGIIYIHPFMPCADCAKVIIQSGIKEVVCKEASEELRDRWSLSMDVAKSMFEEARIRLRILK